MNGSARKLGVVLAVFMVLAFGTATPARAHGWYGYHHHDHGWYGHSHHHGGWYGDYDYDDHYSDDYYPSHSHWHSYDRHHHYWWGGHHHHHHHGCGCW